jgi:hypothetical protein
MDMLVGEPLITTAEYDTAMQRTQACQDVATLQAWYRNTVREIARREEAAGMGVALANMAQGIARFEARLAEGQPAEPVRYATAKQKSKLHQLALHPALTNGERTQVLLKLPRLDEAQAVAKLAELQALIDNRGGAAAPTAPAATPAQCDEVYRLAASLPRAEQRDALRRLPYLTEHEAQAFITGLRLRQGSRLHLPVQVGQQLVQVPVAERHFNAAKVDYVAETGTGRVLPRYETLYGGPLVRRVWAN